MSAGPIHRLHRRFWQKMRWTYFQLFQRHRHNRLVLERAAGRPLLILPEVFNPTLFFTSEFMVASFNERLIPPGSRVLDMGTGSGIGAIFAAQWAGAVTAVDINPAAVRCATINVLLNHLEGCVDVRQGDLFTAVPGEHFDIILFNPPYFPGDPQNMLDYAFYSIDIIPRFAAQATDHLTDQGAILLLLSSDTAVADILHLFDEQGFAASIVARQKMPGETILLYRLVCMR
ncbi:MAG TPA: methyltransferase [Chloroflexota bacterium]|nr:methyltransferase [Chloroflexota bacterium]HUM70043.1 methyltransferase [Chloroflexota bacterium]